MLCETDKYVFMWHLSVHSQLPEASHCYDMFNSHRIQTAFRKAQLLKAYDVCKTYQYLHHIIPHICFYYAYLLNRLRTHASKLRDVGGVQHCSRLPHPPQYHMHQCAISEPPEWTSPCQDGSFFSLSRLRAGHCLMSLLCIPVEHPLSARHEGPVSSQDQGAESNVF